MGFGDKFNELKDKAKDLAGQHPDQVDQGFDKAKDFANDKTGGKYSDQIDQGADKLRDQFGGNQ